MRGNELGSVVRADKLWLTMFNQQRVQCLQNVVRILVEFLGSVGSLLSFVIAFFPFEWWLPIVSLAIGYMLVAPLLVRPNTFGVFYKLQSVLTLISIGCSLMILEMYFKFL